MRAKVTILSTDVKLKLFLSAELTSHGFLTEKMANSLADVPKYVDKAQTNVLILDTDTLIVPAQNLQNIIDAHGLFVILLGVKNVAPLLLGGIKGSISKPDVENSFAKKIFVRNIINRIEHFMRTYTNIRPGDLAQAADVGATVVAIAASTGGTEALHTLLAALPAAVPPILIVQHMPSIFTHQFAMRLDRVCKFPVKEAAQNDLARAGQALVAPGDYHMKAVRQRNKLLLECFRGEKVHGVRPAADVLFDSMAEFMGPKVIGVVLTGMGTDGARGLYKLKRKGATIIAQDKETSVVYGMPKAAVDMGIVDYQLPLDEIAGKILRLTT